MRGKEAFTLLELLITITIVGILATFAIPQYMNILERARGTEAKDFIEHLRRVAHLYWIKNGSFDEFDDAAAGIGFADDQIPQDCRPTHYFWYTITESSENEYKLFAVRCTQGEGGKPPDAPPPALSRFIVFSEDLSSNQCTWTAVGFDY